MSLDLFDTHAHLHFPEFDADREAVMARAREAGVRRMLTIGTEPESSRAAVSFAAREADVWATVGIHPHDAAGADAAARAEEALRREARDRYTIVTRRELDALGAMTGATFALEAAPGWAIAGDCGKGLETSGRAGAHGFLPSRPSMSTGFIAAGAGINSGVALERIGLVDVAPTAARLLGLTMPSVEGRVLQEILR